MRWLILLSLVGVMIQILAPNAFALNESLGFEENSVFQDHNNISIVEVVENELGLACTDCDVRLTLIFPNGSLYLVRGMNMTLLNSTGHYNATINNASTIGIYILSINATRENPSSTTFNGTSDRSFIEIVDVYPRPQSNWELGLIITLMSSAFIMLFISNKHNLLAYKLIFFAFTITMPLLILSALYNIMIINLGESSNAASYIVIMFISYFTVFLLIIGLMILNMWKDIIAYANNMKLKIK